MFDDDIPEFAVQGERGIDVFRRLDDESQRRARYRCIATVAGDGALHDHAPEARRDPAALREHAARLREDPLLSAFSLGDPASWPLAAGAADPMRLFLYVDFFRAWQVADLAGARFESRLSRPDGASSIAAADLATGVAPVFDFNRVARGLPLPSPASLVLSPTAKAGYLTPPKRQNSWAVSPQ